MSESPINNNWLNGPYEMSFIINNRSPWVDIVTESEFPYGSGGTVRSVRPNRCVVEFMPIPPPVEVEDTEELLYPI